MGNADKWLIHSHLSTELDGRLAIVRDVPRQIVLAGVDGDVSRALLAQRYPQAQFVEMDSEMRLQAALALRPQSWLNKLTGKAVRQLTGNPNVDLPEMAADMLWANLSLPYADDLVAAVENWARALKTDGLLFFAHLGGDSFVPVRDMLAAQGIACAAPTLVDMHDLGDILFHHGFYDPVTDTANLCLEYESAGSLRADWQTLDVWRILRPDDEVCAQTIVDAAIDAGSLRSLTLQTVFGHAVCRAKLKEGEQLVQFHRRTKETE